MVKQIEMLWRNWGQTALDGRRKREADMFSFNTYTYDNNYVVSNFPWW